MLRQLLLFTLFATAIVWGQTGMGTLSGVATCFDYWVPNATVTITGASNFQRTVTADGEGEFTFESIPAGEYIIRGTAPDYTGSPAETVTLVAGESRWVEVHLMRKVTEANPAPPSISTKFTTVNIFYATDRKATGIRQPAKFYGGDRLDTESNDLGLELGKCEVSIPFSHHIGELEAPSIIKLEFNPDPIRHIVLMSVTPTEKDQLYRELKARVMRSAKNDAFVFIHGYNTTFEDAARRTAQIAHDLNFKGAPILYSWPSQGGLPQYTIDENNVEWTWRHLAAFLDEVRKNTGAKSIHLIAHSMGNRALARALEAMPRAAAPLFQEVILAAPDIDAAVFKQMAKGFAGKANRITLYASKEDKALAASAVLHGNLLRAGDSKQMVIINGIDSIDASRAITDFLGHAYAFGKSILPDLSTMFQLATPPQDRSNLARQPNGNDFYWLLTP